MIVYRELSSLTQDLQIPAKTLYALSNHLDSHYRPQWIPKASGGFRKLWIPDLVLKTIQRRISTVLLTYMPVSPYAAAYGPGCSPRRNGAVHVGKPLVLKVDILHFFDSISYSMVKNRAFPQEVYAEPLRILLTMLCYYKEGLPQGAPSSPVISNIIFYELDQQIGHWCSQRQIQYSRYCDDLTFSGDFSPAQLLAFLEPLLKGQGFLLNGQKTKIQRRGQQQSVTGLVVNEKLGVPAAYRRQLRQELYYCQKYGVASHLQRIGSTATVEAYRNHLLGQVNYVLSVNPQDRWMCRCKKWLEELG